MPFVEAFLLCTGEMKNANNWFEWLCQALQEKKYCRTCLKWSFDLFLSLNEYSVFFYDAFCLENFGNREEITLCAFLLLQQSYLVRGCNLEIIFSLNHQAQVICQWYFLLCHWFVALTDRFKLAFQSYVIPRVWYYAATQQSINVFLVPVQYQR